MCVSQPRQESRARHRWHACRSASTCFDWTSAVPTPSSGARLCYCWCVAACCLEKAVIRRRSHVNPMNLPPVPKPHQPGGTQPHRLRQQREEGRCVAPPPHTHSTPRAQLLRPAAEVPATRLTGVPVASACRHVRARQRCDHRARQPPLHRLQDDAAAAPVARLHPKGAHQGVPRDHRWPRLEICVRSSVLGCPPAAQAPSRVCTLTPPPSCVCRAGTKTWSWLQVSVA